MSAPTFTTATEDEIQWSLHHSGIGGPVLRSLRTLAAQRDEARAQLAARPVAVLPEDRLIREAIEMGQLPEEPDSVAVTPDRVLGEGEVAVDEGYHEALIHLRVCAHKWRHGEAPSVPLLNASAEADAIHDSLRSSKGGA